MKTVPDQLRNTRLQYTHLQNAVEALVNAKKLNDNEVQSQNIEDILGNLSILLWDLREEIKYCEAFLKRFDQSLD